MDWVSEIVRIALQARLWKGVAVAAFVHAAAAAFLLGYAVSSYELALRPEFSGRTLIVSIASQEAYPTPDVLVWNYEPYPASVTPDRAEVARHTFREEFAADSEGASSANREAHSGDAMAALVAEIGELPPRGDSAESSEPQANSGSNKSEPTAGGGAPPRTVAPPPVSQASSAAPAPASAGTTDTPPSFAGNRPPRYPELARRNRWEGTVVLRLRVEADGSLSSVTVHRSSGYPILDAEAVNAVRMWRAKPATQRGRPAAVDQLFEVWFHF